MVQKIYVNQQSNVPLTKTHTPVTHKGKTFVRVKTYEKSGFASFVKTLGLSILGITVIPFAFKKFRASLSENAKAAFNPSDREVQIYKLAKILTNPGSGGSNQGSIDPKSALLKAINDGTAEDLPSLLDSMHFDDVKKLLKKNPDLKDVKIVCADGTFVFNEFLLENCSPYFKMALARNKEQGKPPQINMNTVTVKEAMLLLSFSLCPKSSKCNKKELLRLTTLADEYDCPNAQKKCKQLFETDNSQITDKVRKELEYVPGLRDFAGITNEKEEAFLKEHIRLFLDGEKCDETKLQEILENRNELNLLEIYKIDPNRLNELLAMCPNLDSLKISLNHWNKADFDAFVDKNSNLKNLKLTNCSCSLSEISKLENLETLEIEGTIWRQNLYLEEALPNLTELKVLKIDNVPLDSLECLENLQDTLEVLVLKGVGFSTFPEDFEFPNLRTLILDSIGLEIPISTFAAFPSLKQLALGNCIIYVDDEEFKLPEIEELSMIHQSDNDDFSWIKQLDLKRLELKVRPTYPDSGSLQNILELTPNLRSLELDIANSNCDIRAITTLKNLTDFTIKNLDSYNNHYVDLSCLKEVTSLRKFEVYNLYLDSPVFLNGSAGRLRELRLVNITGDFDEEIMFDESMPKLHTLQISKKSYRKTKDFSMENFKYFPNLKKLLLGRNEQIAYSPDGIALVDLEMLECVIDDDDIDPEAFQWLESCENLHILNVTPFSGSLPEFRGNRKQQIAKKIAYLTKKR